MPTGCGETRHEDALCHNRTSCPQELARAALRHERVRWASSGTTKGPRILWFNTSSRGQLRGHHRRNGYASCQALHRRAITQHQVPSGSPSVFSGLDVAGKGPMREIRLVYRNRQLGARWAAAERRVDAAA
jgi:hypothetical protein